MNDIIVAEGSLFNQKHALAIRIWHWVTFSLFAATIIVVLLANTLFDTRSNIAMVQDQAKTQGVVITTAQAKAITHDFNDKLWNTHKIIGFVLCFSLLCRVIIEVAISKEERLATKIKLALSISKNASASSDAKHYLFTKYGYLVFYILFTIMACTGLILAFEDVEFLKPVEHLARSIHGFVQYCIYGYILLHIGGVIRADITANPGIISRMINSGRK